MFTNIVGIPASALAVSITTHNRTRQFNKSVQNPIDTDEDGNSLSVMDVLTQDDDIRQHTSVKDQDAIQEIQGDAAMGQFDILMVFILDRPGCKEDEPPFVV